MKAVLKSTHMNIFLFISYSRWFKQFHNFSALTLNFAVKCFTTKVQTNVQDLTLSGTYCHPVNAGPVYLLSYNIYLKQEHRRFVSC